MAGCAAIAAKTMMAEQEKVVLRMLISGGSLVDRVWMEIQLSGEHWRRHARTARREPVGVGHQAKAGAFGSHVHFTPGGPTRTQVALKWSEELYNIWYSRGEILQGKGAQIAGLSRREFIEALGRAQVDAIQIDDEDLKHEVERDLQARRERLSALGG